MKEQLQLLAKNLANLIKVKTLTTLVVIGVFAVLALRGTLAPDTVMVVVTTVIAFYFGTVSERNAQGVKTEKNTEGE